MPDLSRVAEWQTGGPVVTDASGRGDVPGTTYAVHRGPSVATHTSARARPLVAVWIGTIGLILLIGLMVFKPF